MAGGESSRRCGRQSPTPPSNPSAATSLTCSPDLHFPTGEPPPIRAETAQHSVYQCPVYKTAPAAGTLINPPATSTNYSSPVHLPSDQPPNTWINAGVACLCQLKH
uniref:Dynein heavy chain C-terminal domain-containing protein n=1 Tax=Astyanax mexicanus TaxID=7994 RepID=A0A3B1JX24_ASTMX